MTGTPMYFRMLKMRKLRQQAARKSGCTGKNEQASFVVLSWKQCGSNYLSEMLHGHSQVTMHKELFDPVDINTYHPETFQSSNGWTALKRDLSPFLFMDHVWSCRLPDKQEELVNPNSKTVGYVSYPEHIQDEAFFQACIQLNSSMKKIVLYRKDELALFVDMKRAELGQENMATDQTVTVDPTEFQAFVNNYRDTLHQTYESPFGKRDTFKIAYEELMDEEQFACCILPQLWDFLGVKYTEAPKSYLRNMIAQTQPLQDLSEVISNYEELEHCFRHSNILHFAKNKNEDTIQVRRPVMETLPEVDSSSFNASWSLLLPINHHEAATTEEASWKLLQDFATSLRETISKEQLLATECVVGIDVDDDGFHNETAKKRIQALLPCKSVLVDIQRPLRGQVFKIWNALAQEAVNDFIAPVSSDTQLLDAGWQQNIVKKFHLISKSQDLPFGAACVAFHDKSSLDCPTSPVVHRWHMKHFGSLVPDKFCKLGGNFYLYELYSRFNAAAFELSSRLANKIGGNVDTSYDTFDINWQGQLLTSNIDKLQKYTKTEPKGVCIDVIVPSYRVENDDYLRRIAMLRASANVYVKFWFVLDNPKQEHITGVTRLAKELNEENMSIDGNYIVRVVHYGANKGASFARNYGYRASASDWVLFIDDDVIPDKNILDAYVGALKRYPQAKVHVGLTNLPAKCNIWTEMLQTCNIAFFYEVSQYRTHPAFGVTANLMVRGNRHNPRIHFKEIYPKTGGGEDVDFVYQFREQYKSVGRAVVVGVPEAKARHPWWNKGGTCYKQFNGWAWGDSLCITEWPKTTYMTFPNWIEYIAFVLPLLMAYSGKLYGGLVAALGIFLLDHVLKTSLYFSGAREASGGGVLRSLWVALGAGSINTGQEVTRAYAVACRRSWFTLCRRFNWFEDAEEGTIAYLQRQSFFRFALYVGITWAMFQRW